MSRQPALRLDRFSYAYPGVSERALRDVTVEIGAGEFVVVVGRSGSGKSTLLRVAGGLVPHHFGGVAGGEVSVCGRDLREHRPAELADVCGTVMQDPEIQVVMGNVRHEIAFPLENLGLGAAHIDDAVDRVARLLGIERLLGRRTDELSGGELQRVVLAAALAPEPPLLALDEPTSQLDPESAGEFLRAVARARRKRGLTVLLADHRLEQSLEVADRVLVLNDGALEFDGDPAQYLAWASRRAHDRWMMTPAARLISLAGLGPPAASERKAGKLITAVFDRTGPAAPSTAAAQHPSADAARSAPAPRPASQAPRPASQAPRPALQLESVSFTYPGAASPALRDVTLSLDAGERLALLGRNGSGKSTLLRLARGLLSPQHGVVRASRKTGLLLQNPNDYLIHERVADEAPLESLERFGLADLVERDPRQLSGGQRQRLALAIVMQERPGALLLDEPTRGMDRDLKLELAELLEGFAALGTAVVLATHDVEFAAGFASRVVVLDDGRVASDGEPVEVFGGGSFATATARLLPGSGALTPEAGAAMLARLGERPLAEVSAKTTVGA